MDKRKSSIYRIARQQNSMPGAFWLLSDLLDIYLKRKQAGMFQAEDKANSLNSNNDFFLNIFLPDTLQELLGNSVVFVINQLGLFTVKDAMQIVNQMIKQGWYPELETWNPAMDPDTLLEELL